MTLENFRNIGVVGGPDGVQLRGTLQQLAHYLQSRDCTVILEEDLVSALDGETLQTGTRAQLGQSCDLVIAVGGDGSLLGAGRTFARHGVPVLGINRGRLGFLTDVHPSELEQRVGQVLDGDYAMDERFLLDLRVRRDGTPSGEGMALNDVVLTAGESIHMIEFELWVDGDFVYTQRSDGLIISTPTGSTAYALSGGGPIMHPALDAIALVPMNPHTLSSRPLVVGGNSELHIRLMSPHLRPLVSCDGQEGIRLREDDVLSVRKNPHRLRLLHPPGHDFYQACRSKLGWSARPGEERTGSDAGE